MESRVHNTQRDSDMGSEQGCGAGRQQVKDMKTKGSERYRWLSGKQTSILPTRRVRHATNKENEKKDHKKGHTFGRFDSV